MAGTAFNPAAAIFMQGDSGRGCVLREVLPKLHEIAVREPKRSAGVAPFQNGIDPQIWLAVSPGGWQIRDRGHFFALACLAMRRWWTRPQVPRRGVAAGSATLPMDATPGGAIGLRCATDRGGRLHERLKPRIQPAAWKICTTSAKPRWRRSPKRRAYVPAGAPSCWEWAAMRRNTLARPAVTRARVTVALIPDLDDRYEQTAARGGATDRIPLGEHRPKSETPGWLTTPHAPGVQRGIRQE